MRADDPRHGLVAGYIAGCRKQCCRDAIARYEKGREWDRMNGRERTVPVIGARRRVRALQRLGWASTHLSQRLGHSAKWLEEAVGSKNQGGRIYLETHRKIVALYEELCMTPGPSAITRRRAEGNGWPPPLAWDDIDDPNEKPSRRKAARHKDDLDHAVVHRVLNGERLAMSQADRRAVVHVLRDQRGWSEKRIETHTGITQAGNTTRYPREETAA